jgi:membrane protein DedA with SNARE-associated domain
MIAQVLTAVAATQASSPPPNLPGFLNVVAPYLEHYSYWAVLLLVMIEDFGVPVPGETVLIAAAIFAGAGRLNVVVVGLVGFVAAVIGDNIGFAIGHFGGRALALRWGKYVFLTEERLAKAEVFFNRHGGKIIVVARFIEGLRQANGIIAGISGMRWWRFVIFNALGAALWVGTWVSLGYLAGSHINAIYHYITQYSLYALIALVVVLVVLILRHVLHRRGRAAQQAAPEPQENTGPSHRPGIHEDPEASEQYEAKEAEAIQEVSGTEKGTKTEEADGIQGGAETPDRESQTAAETPDRESQTAAETPDSAESQTAAETPDRESQTAAETPDSAESQTAAETPDDVGIPNGTEIPKSARTQSS